MRKRKIEVFDEWRADERAVSELVQRVAEGQTLREFCKSVGLPYSLVAKFIAQTPAVKAEYDAALAIWADAMAQESLGIADGVAGADESAAVSAAKLRVETRLKLAGKYDRERYGEREAAPVAVTINLGDVAREIAAIEQRLGLAVQKPSVLTAPEVEISETEII